MGKEGLEPSPTRDMILSHARLPIPPLPHLEFPNLQGIGIIVKCPAVGKGAPLLKFDTRYSLHINIRHPRKDGRYHQLGKPKQSLHLVDAV